MPKRSPGESWACSACGELLVGAKTISGKVAPIEAKRSDEANCFLFRREVDGEYEVRVAVLTGPLLEEAKRQGFELRYNHFATCPHAERFRPPKDVASPEPEPGGGDDDGTSDTNDAGVGRGVGAGGAVPDGD